MDRFETPQYLRQRAEELRNIAFEHLGEYARSLINLSAELETKAAEIEAQLEQGIV